MWKLMIADDEPKIRRGLRQVLPWEELDIEVTGEAEDGLDALEKAQALKPDLIFVDICMPFMDGLSFIEQLRFDSEGALVIVITGHDEFKYAQQAVKLKVFDYILKPVEKAALREVVEKALRVLDQNKTKSERFHWANHQLQSNSNLIRDTFLRKWMAGVLSPVEIQSTMAHLKLPVGANRMAVFKVLQSTNVGAVKRDWNKDLLEFAVKNIIEEVVAALGEHIVFSDDRGHVVVLSSLERDHDWMLVCGSIQSKIEEILSKIVVAADRLLEPDVLAAERIYHDLVREVGMKVNFSPIVMLARKYVDQSFAEPNLTLQDVADHVRVSPTYLSKLLKKEVGLSFIDYITEIRIRKAMLYMNDPNYKVYEIAEKVGYNSQHYFSNAFKKITGVSPMSYRKGCRT
ncbi:response regulator [Paenibacillus sp.]|uniref:response regulator n=1 Tax=Paenibacillus TaxID=44249 RepID=UPI003563E99E